MESLSPRQQEVLDLILTCIGQQGRFPSIRELAAHLRVSSPATVFQHLGALEAKGYLRRRGRHWVVPPDVRRDRGIPIVGRVAAGAPLLAVEQIEGNLDPEFLGLAPGRFGVRVIGDSMEGEGILAGDHVIVDPDLPVTNGELVVAYLGEEQEVTVKRFHRRRGGGVELRPANPRYRPIVIDATDPHFRLAGKVVGLVRRF